MSTPPIAVTPEMFKRLAKTHAEIAFANLSKYPLSARLIMECLNHCFHAGACAAINLHNAGADMKQLGFDNENEEQKQNTLAAVKALEEIAAKHSCDT